MEKERDQWYQWSSKDGYAISQFIAFFERVDEWAPLFS